MHKTLVRTRTGFCGIYCLAIFFLPQVDARVWKESNAAKMVQQASGFLPLDSHFSDSELGSVCWFSRAGLTLTQAWFRRRSTHVPNLTDEISTAKRRCLNQIDTAVFEWCGKSDQKR